MFVLPSTIFFFVPVFAVVSPVPCCVFDHGYGWLRKDCGHGERNSLRLEFASSWKTAAAVRGFLDSLSFSCICYSPPV